MLRFNIHIINHKKYIYKQDQIRNLNISYQQMINIWCRCLGDMLVLGTV